MNPTRPQTVPPKSAKRIAGVIIAALVIGFALVCAGLLQGCWLTGTPGPKPDPKTIATPGGKEAAKLGETVRTEIPAAVLEQQAQQRKATSRAVAQFEAITYSAGTIAAPEDMNAKTAITESAEQGKRELGGESTAEDRAEALAAANAFLAGEIEKGRALIANAKAEADEAKKARDAANDAVRVALEGAKRQADAADAEARRLAGENQKRFDSLEGMIRGAREEAARAKDEARKEMDSLLFKCLLGLGGLLILIAVGIAVLTQGTQVLRSAICAGGGAFCFAVAWTLNQPWFKWVAIGGGALGAIAIGAFLWTEFRTTKDAKKKTQTLGELERVRAAGRKVVATLDDWKSEVGEATAKPLLEKLSRRMNDDEKIAVHDLRRESAVAVKAPKP